jgi:hypothetical protein
LLRHGRQLLACALLLCDCQVLFGSLLLLLLLLFAFLGQLFLYLLDLDPVVFLFDFSHFVSVFEEAHDVELLLVKVVIQILIQFPEILILELACLQLRISGCTWFG